MQTLELEWMDTAEPLEVIELARQTGLTSAELADLLDYGALTPVNPTDQTLLFPLHCVPALRRAASLRQTYDLDLFAMVLLLDQLRRIESLEQQLQALQARR